MRHVKSFLIFSILLTFATLAPETSHAQVQTFTDANVDYKLELPSSTWRVVSRPDGLQNRAEFIFGDRLDGHLQIHKETVEPGVTPSDFAATYKDQKLRFRPGYIDGKTEKFVGRLNGVAVSYEYTHAGKPMTGRAYYLQADNRTIYVLHFTGLRDKLDRIRNQTDGIARTFSVK
jgi:hypothetical protein